MSSPTNPTASSTTTRTLEIAHVLFMDIVAYSQLPMDRQTRAIETLQQVVRNTSDFIQAHKRRQLLRLPTGDGMALVFFGDAEAAARCALEISRTLKQHPDLKLRMGIHTGPVHRVEDINANRNVAGGGINLAQRVVDCGDAGHILVSSSVADVLDNISSWKPLLHDLGNVQVKHGVTVHIYNLYSDDAGNRDVPQKLVVAEKAVSSARARKKLSLGLISAAVLAALAIAGFFYFRPSRKLTDKDTLVLADFENKTGDPVFDDTLNTALSAELAQSPFLDILNERIVRRTLKLMGHSPRDRVTWEIAKEICVRTGNKAVLAGSISGMGNHFAIALQASACVSGETIAKEFSDVPNRDAVLGALHDMAVDFREKLGESLVSIEKFDAPFSETTSSLEALKTYTTALQVYHSKGEAEAIPVVKHAIEQDPNFAEAYTFLGTAYANLGQSTLAEQALKKAFDLSGGVSEAEKFHIAADYYANGSGDLEKAMQTYTAWSQAYPRSLEAPDNLAVIYNILGQYDKALPLMQQDLQRKSDDVLSFANLAGVFLALNRLDDAKALFDQAAAHKLNSGFLRQMIYYYSFLKNDNTAMEAQVNWAMNRPGDEDLLLSLQSDTEAYYGRVAKAREFSRRASESAIRADSKDTAALWQASAALREAEFGNAALARQGVAGAVALAPGQNVKVLAALALARIGDTAKAAAIVAQLQKDYPENTVLKVFWLPPIKATIAMKGSNPQQAIEALAISAPYELGEPFPYELGTMYPTYVRAQAYLLAHNSSAAAAECQKILDHSGLTANFYTGALAHLLLARAYAHEAADGSPASADSAAKARKAYQDFLALWKDADPDVPILKEAKAEFAKLQ